MALQDSNNKFRNSVDSNMMNHVRKDNKIKTLLFWQMGFFFMFAFSLNLLLSILRLYTD